MDVRQARQAVSATETRRSELRQEAAALSIDKELTDEKRARLDAIGNEVQDVERQYRAAKLVLESFDTESVVASGDAPVDAEHREKLELREKANLGNFLIARMRGSVVTGAEAEYLAAHGGEAGQIPVDLLEKGREARATVTPAPGTVGVNMQTIQPAIFDQAVVARSMGVAMPQVGSGTYAEPVIGTSVTANAVAAGSDVPQTAGAITVQTTTPHRIGGSIGIAVEDIASIGVGNFEAALRQNLQLAIADRLDEFLLTGDDDDDSDEPNGFLDLIAAPTATTPTSGTADFADIVGMFASQVDGRFAMSMQDIMALTSVTGYAYASVRFRGNSSDRPLETWLRESTGGLMVTNQMPTATSELSSKAGPILFRKMGASNPSVSRVAVCPHWGMMSVDDIFTDARKGHRQFTVSVLVGDLIIVQSDVFTRLSLRTVT